jgi:acetyltransferase-like isoleucine patch superfamily enzyme
MDSDHHTIWDEHGNIINYPEEILIEDNVWIGCRALILKGSKIPSKSVIAANTVVNKKLEDCNSLYADIPVKMMRNNIN